MKSRKYSSVRITENVEDIEDDDNSLRDRTSNSETGSTGSTEDTSGVQREELPCTMPRHMWCEPDSGPTMVRGPDYNNDKKKVPSAPPAFQLVSVDLFETCGSLEHVASRPDNLVQIELAKYKERGEEMPFTFLLNFLIPGTPRYSLVVYYQVLNKKVLNDGSPFAELMTDFLEGYVLYSSYIYLST